MGTRHYRYESISAIRDMAQGAFTSERHKNMANSYTGETYDRESWHGIKGGAVEVMRVMLAGYPEGEARIATLLCSLDGKLPKAVGIGRKLVRGMQGDELDIHAVNRGDISRAWSSRQRMIKKGITALKIIADIGGNCTSSADILQWRGIAAIALSEIMTKAGYSTEIAAAWAVKDHIEGRGKFIAAIECVCKPRGASADMGLLAATLALPGFFRTVGFAAIVKHADDENRRADDGLGRHVDAEQVIPVLPNVTNLFVPASICDEESATAWIKSTIEMLQSIKGVQ